MKLRLLPLLCLTLLFALAGCTNVSEIIASGLKIELVRVTRAADGSCQVTWRIRNPNVVPYLVDHAVHKLTLGGAVVGTINVTDRIAVPRESQVEQTHALTPAGADTAARLAELAGRGSADYRVDSTVWLLIFDDEREKAALTGSGTVPVTAQ